MNNRGKSVVEVEGRPGGGDFWLDAVSPSATVHHAAYATIALARVNARAS